MVEATPVTPLDSCVSAPQVSRAASVSSEPAWFRAGRGRNGLPNDFVEAPAGVEVGGHLMVAWTWVVWLRATAIATRSRAGGVPCENSRHGRSVVSMCSGGRLLADFMAGTDTAPDVPEVVRACLTETTDGRWVVWAQKLARPEGDRYGPLTRGGSYPADAVAACRVDSGHDAPQPDCSCGFHALSRPRPDLVSGPPAEALLSILGPRLAGGGPIGRSGTPLPFGVTALEVVLSGRVLALKWHSGAVLFRAARQTVVRPLHGRPTPAEPDDPGAVLARVRTPYPKGEGPRRLSLPAEAPLTADVADDAGFCALVDAPQMSVRRPLLTRC
jgi:hypothetical protein